MILKLEGFEKLRGLNMEEIIQESKTEILEYVGRNTKLKSKMKNIIWNDDKIFFGRSKRMKPMKNQTYKQKKRRNKLKGQTSQLRAWNLRYIDAGNEVIAMLNNGELSQFASETFTKILKKHI